MTYIICYDIAEDKIRLRVAKYLEGVGYRVQHSVFIFKGSEDRAEAVRIRLAEITAAYGCASLLVAPMCASCAARMWTSGAPMEERQSCIVA